MRLRHCGSIQLGRGHGTIASEPAAGHCHYFCLPRLMLQKALRVRELPHIGADTDMRALLRQARRRQRAMHMRSTSIAIAIVVAIGLIWSVAAMSKLVPVDGSEMRSAAISAEELAIRYAKARPRSSGRPRPRPRSCATMVA